MAAGKCVLVADPIHEQGKALLASTPGLAVDVATGLDEGALCQRIGDYDALIVRSKTRVTAPVIAAGKKLRVIGRAGIGVDNIDVAAATEHGIVVFNTPDANATTTAELALAHLLSLSRHLPQADRSVRRGEWKPGNFIGTELAEKTVGIVGFGTIGRIVARRCLAFRMRVLAFDPFVVPDVIRETGAEPADLDTLLASADYVTLHCPLNDATRNLLDASRLAKMKPGARLINCARGGLIDEAALLEALASGHLAGAALDVYGKEPPGDSPLLRLDNVVMTPHLGASTQEAQQAVSVKIAEQIAAFLVTGAAQSAVNLPRIPSDQLIRARPYQQLALALGRLLSALMPGPIAELEVALFGRIADVDPRLITAGALAGLLSKRLAVPVNEVNASTLAHRQGIAVREVRAHEARDYVSLVELRAKTGEASTSVAGTLLGESHPRLVCIDDYHVEAVPEGCLIFTRHDDRPGVVGALGGILGRENINISRMQVGVAEGRPEAIALVGVSAPLPPKALEEVRAIPAIRQAVQIEL
ncbi:MAG: phosphoglycerate dehydrogenase [Hyphomicrobium sp.]|uniref:phosphoglycerate dehydrogenase n=1 Tax=Hyphomicrobium sp. TaxID=82 RepID=UPI0013216C01|nr:phosphoglycerate dehydrogenase [Hyphomicrobium sp.]KAB2939671.1 MAG: phosphoglycerate dehydrogenase [Hyphomicrobium sp.]MBZ0208053.1 phosphoglycerate dehydrogenase [Hyphomicrobium sp.]